MPTQNFFFYIFDIQKVLILALVFMVCLYYIRFVWKKRHMFKKSWNYPGPFNLPLIGAGYLFMTRPEYILEKITQLQSKYPEGLKLWFGNRLIYILTEPEHVEKVLASTKLVHKEVLYKHIIDCVGEGLLTAPAHKWKKHRKTIFPSFNQKILDSFVEVFAETGLTLAEVLEKNIADTSNIYQLLSNCTLDAVCETAMGLKLDLQRKNSPYTSALNKIMKLIYLKIFQLWNHNEFIWKHLSYGKEIEKELKIFKDLTDLVIHQKIEVLEAKNQRKSSTAFIEEAAQKRLAFLDYIMASGQFSPLELREEVTIFLIAGTDTTAATLSFLFAVLGMFPDVQQKVLEEVIEIMGNDRQPEFKDLPNMHYTERVIKETLRLFPVGAFFLRAVTEDVDMGDFVIPQGASAYFGLVFIHRNPKYWPDPLKFDPDRFLPEEVAKRHPCCFIPFSYGPRNCIGMKYAMMNMKVIVATVLRKFQIHCDYKKIEDINLKANVVLRFKDGPKVSLTHREKSL